MYGAEAEQKHVPTQPAAGRIGSSSLSFAFLDLAEDGSRDLISVQILAIVKPE